MELSFPRSNKDNTFEDVVDITDNIIANAKCDGIKVENCGADVNIATNNIASLENGIRVKNFVKGCKVTVVGNTVDVANMKEHSGDEPWALLVLNGNAELKPVLNIKDNVKNGSTEYWSSITENRSDDSDCATPFKD